MSQKNRSNQIPTNWIKASLGEILSLEYGKSLPRKNRKKGKYPVYGSNGIVGYHNEYLVESPIIILGRKGSVGTVHISNENSWPIDTTYYIRPSKNLNLKFIYYLLSHLDLSRLDNSTTIPGLNRDIIYSQIVNLPPLNEQLRIVSILEELLSSIEKGKEQLNKSLEQLNLYKDSILKQAFEGDLSKKWRESKNNVNIAKILNEININKKRHYEIQLEQYKRGKREAAPKEPEKVEVFNKFDHQNICDLPDGWFHIKLKDICDSVQRVSSIKTDSSQTFIYFDIGGIDNKKNIIQNFKKYQWENAPSRAHYIVEKNDILFSTVRTYLKKIAIVSDGKNLTQIASSGFAIIRTIPNCIDVNFLFKYIISDKFIQPLNILQTGSSYPAVRSSDVFEQFIPMCSLEEQSIISKELDRQFSIINNLEQTIEDNLFQITLLVQNLYKKAFNGEFLVQNPNDEPASLLLEQIKKEKEVYLSQEKEKKINEIKTSIVMPKKSILEILKEEKGPILSKDLWLLSNKADDIDEFYAELKKLIESGNVIELPREGRETFLKFTDKNEDR